jgi:hypothetical protein
VEGLAVANLPTEAAQLALGFGGSLELVPVAGEQHFPESRDRGILGSIRNLNLRA